jgi:hypothetical protein
MNRRGFIRAFAGAVATVAIGMKLSQGMSDLTQPSFDLVPENVQFKVTERFIGGDVDWRGVYGTSVTA